MVEDEHSEVFLDRKLANENLEHSVALSRFTGVTLLNRQTYELMLGWDHLRALDLSKRSAVHSTLLLRKNFIQKDDYTTVAWSKPPFAVMVSTPVPPVSWGRALRICFTLEAKRKRIYGLVNALRKLNLYVRHIDSGDGLDLSDFQMVGPDLQRQDLCGSDDIRNSIRPTTIITLEVPHESMISEDFDRTEVYERRGVLLSSIHNYLNAWSASRSSNTYVQSLTLKSGMVTELSEGLQHYGCNGVRIEWVSPLQMLASLKNAMIPTMLDAENRSKKEKFTTALKRVLDEENLGDENAEKLEELVRDIEASLPRSEQERHFVNSTVNMPIIPSSRVRGSLCVSLSCWKKLLDPTSRNNIELSLSPGESSIAAVLNVDKEERTLTAEFLSLQHYAVIQFELIFPSGRADHRWKEWVIEAVSYAGGGIVRSFTMGNLEGRWGRAVVIAWFPFTEAAERECATVDAGDDSAEDFNRPEGEHSESDRYGDGEAVPSAAAIARIIECIRSLKGSDLFAREMDSNDGELDELDEVANAPFVDRVKSFFSRPGDNIQAGHASDIEDGQDTHEAADEGAATLPDAPSGNAYDKVHRYIKSERNNLARELLSDYEAEIAIRRPYRSDTTLRDVKVWYRWPKSTRLDHRTSFVPNPFNYTRPLNYDDHSRYYDQNVKDENKSRLRLAKRIAQRFSDPEDGSVILIGAHRSGKTSVINMVLDIIGNKHNLNHTLRSKLLGFPEDDAPIVGIRINASVTPAHQFLFAIVRELDHQIADIKGVLRASAKKAAEEAKSAIFQAARAVGDITSFAIPKELEIKGKIPGAEFTSTHAWANKDDRRWIRLRNRKEELQASDLAKALSIREKDGLWDTPEGQAAFLRLSIECLRNAMKILNVNRKDPAQKITLVIAVDEIAESAAWGGAQAFPVWRHLVESQDFRHVRWLFSSTRPPRDATGYSPLSNALREYLMRPLNRSEASQLVDNFDPLTKSDADTISVDGIPLVVTYGAREFIGWVTGCFPYLIQVLCVHVYDRAISYHVPIITTALVRKILESRVTGLLTDYFSAQWGTLSEESQNALTEELRDLNFPLGKLGYELPDHSITLTPRVAREVQMAGLGGVSTGNPVAPIFIHWWKQSSVPSDHQSDD